MSAPKIPNPWTFNIHTDDDLLSDIHLKELPIIKLEASIKEIPLIKTDSKFDAKFDGGLNISVKELPVVHLRLGMEPTRVHMPVDLKFGVSLLGMQLLCFDVCGESMVVIEDYKPHKTEECV